MTIVTYAPGDAHPEGEQPALMCRAHPPTTVVIDGDVAHVWPTVEAHDYCGEWADIVELLPLPQPMVPTVDLLEDHPSVWDRVRRRR